MGAQRLSDEEIWSRDARECPCFSCRRHLKEICIDHPEPQKICAVYATYLSPEAQIRKRYRQARR